MFRFAPRLRRRRRRPPRRFLLARRADRRRRRVTVAAKFLHPPGGQHHRHHRRHRPPPPPLSPAYAPAYRPETTAFLESEDSSNALLMLRDHFSRSRFPIRSWFPMYDDAVNSVTRVTWCRRFQYAFTWTREIFLLRTTQNFILTKKNDRRTILLLFYVAIWFYDGTLDLVLPHRSLPSSRSLANEDRQVFDDWWIWKKQEKSCWLKYLLETLSCFNSHANIFQIVRDANNMERYICL